MESVENTRKSYELVAKDDDSDGLPEKFDNSLWSSLLEMEENQQKSVISDDEVKSIEECLQELEHTYPEIPVQKIFQQYLICQKKIIMTDLKKVQAAKLASESIWSRHKKDEETDRIAQEAKRKAEEKEREMKNGGKDIRKMFTTKKTKKSVKNETNSMEDLEKKSIDQGKTNTEKEDSNEKKSRKSDSSIREEDCENYNKQMKVSVRGLIGKKKKRGRGKRKISDDDDDDDDVEQEEVIEKASREGKDIATMFAKIPEKIKCPSENETQSPAIENIPSQLKELDEQSQNHESSAEKKKNKKKRGLDFLKIKFVESNHEKEEVETNKVPSKDIRSMFSKTGKLKKSVPVKADKTDFLCKIEDENVNGYTELPGGDVESSEDVEMKDVVEAQSQEKKNNDTVNEEKKRKDAPSEEAKSKKTPSKEKTNNQTPPVEKGKSNLLSYFSKPVVKAEKIYFPLKKTDEKVQTLLSDQDIKSKIVKTEVIETLKDDDVIVMTNTKSSTNPNVTLCKVELSKIASPTPCFVNAEDISSLIPESNSLTKINRKRKRSFNGQPEPLANKVQKQNKVNVSRNSRELSDSEKEGKCETVDEDTKDEKKEETKTVDVKENGSNLRRSSRSRKKINYNELNLSADAIKTNIGKPQVKENQKKKEVNMNDNEVDFDQSVCIVEEKMTNTEQKIDKEVKLPARELCFPESPKRKTRPVIDLVLDEITMNSFLSWTDRYQPIKARHVIGDKNKTKELFTWLCSWKEKHESIIKKMAARAARQPKKRGTSDFDSESSDESDEEELLSNTLVLTGPIGCGTTSSVVACAKQMDFKVLELNPTIYRTGKNMYDLVSEAVVSHRIQKKKFSDGFSANEGKASTRSYEQDVMSLVLVEQADVVYEELDRGFWQGLQDLRRLAKRPMILTANDDRVLQAIHTDENQHTEFIKFNYPTVEQILPMMQILCLVERVFVPSSLLSSIIKFCKNDVRKIMLQLQFWFDQGHHPLFKTWKKENNNDNIVDVETIPSEMKDSVVTISKQISGISNDAQNVVTPDEDRMDNDNDVNNVVADSDNVEKNETEENEKKDSVRMTAKIPCIKKLPLCNKVEMVVDENKITKKDFKFSRKTFSFMKPKERSDLTDPLSRISTIIENLSEIDATFTYKKQDIDFKHKHNFVCSTMVDSLSDQLWGERFEGHTYPDQSLCDCVQETYLHFYKGEHERPFDDYTSNQRSRKHRDLYTGVRSRLPLSSHLDRESLSLHTTPYLRNICASEDTRKTNQRRQRRFLHYLDTTGICLDDDIIRRLREESFIDG